PIRQPRTRPFSPAFGCCGTRRMEGSRLPRTASTTKSGVPCPRAVVQMTSATRSSILALPSGEKSALGLVVFERARLGNGLPREGSANGALAGVRARAPGDAGQGRGHARPGQAARSRLKRSTDVICRARTARQHIAHPPHRLPLLELLALVFEREFSARSWPGGHPGSVRGREPN